MPWSKPVPCDLTRTSTRVSVPQSYAEKVPALPGVCVIIRLDKSTVDGRILNIGETGNLQQRIAGGAPHAPAQAITSDILAKKLPDKSKAVWMITNNDDDALQLKRALITLFRSEFGRRPAYNRTGGNTANYARFQAEYGELKQHVMAL